MSEVNERLKISLTKRLSIVGKELAHGIAEYLSDGVNHSAIRALAEKGGMVFIRVKVDSPGEYPNAESMGEVFDLVEGEQLDLVFPVELGKQIFEGLFVGGSVH